MFTTFFLFNSFISIVLVTRSFIILILLIRSFLISFSSRFSPFKFFNSTKYLFFCGFHIYTTFNTGDFFKCFFCFVLFAFCANKIQAVWIRYIEIYNCLFVLCITLSLLIFVLYICIVVLHVVHFSFFFVSIFCIFRIFVLFGILLLSACVCTVKILFYMHILLDILKSVVKAFFVRLLHAAARRS